MISTPCRRAPSRKIRLAIDPTSVSLPATVLDMASLSHEVYGPAAAERAARRSITAGTLLITFETTAVTALRPATVSQADQTTGDRRAAPEPDPLHAADDDEEADEDDKEVQID